MKLANLKRVLGWFGLEPTLRFTITLRSGVRFRITADELKIDGSVDRIIGLNGVAGRGMPEWVALNEIAMIDGERWIRRKA